MAARTCDDCSIWYPLDQNQCLVCGSATAYTGTSLPDNDWRKQVERKLGVFKASQLPLIHRGNLVDHKDQAWVSNAILEGAGYHDVEVGDIIRVSGYNELEIFFEVGSPAKRLRGEPSNTALHAGWWLNLVDHEGWVPDCIPAEA